MAGSTTAGALVTGAATAPLFGSGAVTGATTTRGSSRLGAPTSRPTFRAAGGTCSGASGGALSGLSKGGAFAPAPFGATVASARSAAPTGRRGRGGSLAVFRGWCLGGEVFASATGAPPRGVARGAVNASNT